MNRVLRHLRRAALLSVGEGLSDAQLLESFLTHRDEVAFEVLLRRHGPMVLRVCRRVLRNAHDAEDAFQATFLVLARKASSIRSRQVLASWLYGVAYRTAMKARAMNTKRRARERKVAESSRVEAPAGEACEELLAQLDYELNRLPDKYRLPVVLCELESRSRKEAARIVGVPEGTLSSRLAQAKKLLARRLSRYGMVAVAALLAEHAASACLSPILRTSTMKAALTAGAVPTEVLTLADGVLKAMFLTKLKITACAAVVMLLTGVGASGLTYRATAQQPGHGSRPRAVASPPQADELEALRLEIEALRKSLQATRERVKTLEEVVATLKRPAKGMAPSSGGSGMGARPSGPTKELAPIRDEGSIVPGPAPITPLPSNSLPPRTTTTPFSNKPTDTAPRPKNRALSPDITRPETSGASEQSAPTQALQPPKSNNGTLSVMVGPAKTSQTTTCPLVDAEKALKQLRANPNDRQAAEALERALKQLREHQVDLGKKN